MQPLDRVPKLFIKKMKTVSLEYVKKLKTDFDFFPDYLFHSAYLWCLEYNLHCPNFSSCALKIVLEKEDVAGELQSISSRLEITRASLMGRLIKFEDGDFLSMIRFKDE